MLATTIAKAVRAPLMALACLGVAISPVGARAPDLRLSDLVNQGSDDAQRELLNRGYVFNHCDQRGSKLWQYRWQPRGQVRVRVAHRSHERNADKHSNEQQVAECERGYRDGLYPHRVAPTDS